MTDEKCKHEDLRCVSSGVNGVLITVKRCVFCGRVMEVICNLE